ITVNVVLRIPQPKGYSGPVISIIRVAAYDLKKYKFQEIIRVGMMIGDILFAEEDNYIINGMIEVMDMTNLTANHLLHLNPSFLKRCSAYSDEGMPLRHKGMHFISTVPQFDTIFNSIKSVMGTNPNRKVQIHGNDMESFYKCVPKEQLPVEYGGQNGTIDEIIEYWSKKLIDYRDYLEEEKLYGSNESLNKDNL
uniref:CRAL-TRIO domain-containing protein n=1 Tax=Megaselia scalaris TaxID=36166 RepID=T1GKI8_MEGSC